MPKMIRKGELPTKTCPACNRPFAWRKKWERDWDRVIYCSERCRRSGKASANTASRPWSWPLRLAPNRRDERECE